MVFGGDSAAGESDGLREYLEHRCILLRQSTCSVESIRRSTILDLLRALLRQVVRRNWLLRRNFHLAHREPASGYCVDGQR